MPIESDPLDRIANLIALLLVKGMSKTESAPTLAAAGFTNKQIAELLVTSEGTVRKLISRAHKAKLEKPERVSDG